MSFYTAWDSRGKEKCQTKQKHPNFRSANQGTRVRINTPFRAVCRCMARMCQFHSETLFPGPSLTARSPGGSLEAGRNVS